MWKAIGDTGFAARVDRSFALCQHLERALATHPSGAFRLVAPRTSVNVCFWVLPRRMRRTMDNSGPSAGDQGAPAADNGGAIGDDIGGTGAKIGGGVARRARGEERRAHVDEATHEVSEGGPARSVRSVADGVPAYGGEGECSVHVTSRGGSGRVRGGRGEVAGTGDAGGGPFSEDGEARNRKGHVETGERGAVGTGVDGTGVDGAAWVASLSEEDRAELARVAPIIKRRMQAAGDAMVGYQPLGGIPPFFRMVMANGDGVSEEAIDGMLDRMAGVYSDGL